MTTVVEHDEREYLGAFLVRAFRAELEGRPLGAVAEWMLSDAWRAVPSSDGPRSTCGADQCAGEFEAA